MILYNQVIQEFQLELRVALFFYSEPDQLQTRADLELMVDQYKIRLGKESKHLKDY